jgi:PD-(D/E)XK endonuclease
LILHLTAQSLLLESEMSKHGVKTRGAVLELTFAAECMQRGAIVSQPFGDDAPYDLLVDNGKRIYRVQVKVASPTDATRRSFSVNTTRKVPTLKTTASTSCVSVPYTAEQLDCIVTKAGDYWFFFSDVDKLPGNVAVYPKADSAAYSWNTGKNRWSDVGLPIPSATGGSDDSPL